jgi:hypothetical protein
LAGRVPVPKVRAVLAIETITRTGHFRRAGSCTRTGGPWSRCDRGCVSTRPPKSSTRARVGRQLARLEARPPQVLAQEADVDSVGRSHVFLFFKKFLVDDGVD